MKVRFLCRWGKLIAYSLGSKAYKCYNNQLCKVVERINVKINKGLLEK